MIDIGKIFNECETALVDAMEMLYQDRPDYFILFLSQAEYNPLGETIDGMSPYMTDYAWDFHVNYHQRNYIIHYLNRNYKRSGFIYTEDSVDDLVTEMMIYSHIWEDVCFVKFLLRLSQLIDGKDYVWKTDVEYHTDLYETIKDKIITPLKTQRLQLGEIIESAYCSHVRNAFSHSMYSIDVNRREILLWGGRSNEKRWQQMISFDEFQEKFLKSIRIWNTLFHLINECRRKAAEAKLVSGIILLPEGKNMLIWAEMRKHGEICEPTFKGQVINLNGGTKR